MTHVSLFTGIGGIDLAAEVAGFETVLQVEREPYALRVLEKHWPDVPRITDVREVHDDERWRQPTVVSGGFPCQAHSTASHGRKVAEDLSGEFVRCIAALRPKYAVGENVGRGIIKQVTKQIENIGYKTIVHGNRAFDSGLGHIRYRWWAIAYPDNESQFQSAFNAEVAIVREIQNDHRRAQDFSRAVRVDDGLPSRVDRFRAIGNAVVPAQAYPIFAAIAEAERAT